MKSSEGVIPTDTIGIFSNSPNFCGGGRWSFEMYSGKVRVNRRNWSFPLIMRAWKRCVRWRTYNCSVGVRVGMEHQETKFMIPLSYINHPLFAKLLEDAEKVYGFEHYGCLRIPCTAENFLHTMGAIKSSCGQIHGKNSVYNVDLGVPLMDMAVPLLARFIGEPEYD